MTTRCTACAASCRAYPQPHVSDTRRAARPRSQRMSSATIAIAEMSSAANTATCHAGLAMAAEGIRLDRCRRHERAGAEHRRNDERDSMPIATHAAASTIVGARSTLLGFVRLGRARAAGGAEEHDAGHLGEARERERPDQRERRRREHREPQRSLVLPAVEQRTVDQPLAHEPVERRQPDDRGGADRRTASQVTGIRRASPPSCSMSRVPVARYTAPAPRNSRLLNSA